MAKDDAAPAGLLSKMARFVRNPSTNWSDLDEKESDRENSAYSKQALKEMIERKRRNDFVRKREFDMLRKLRRREALGVPGTSGDASNRPSFFQSSMPSKPDDRAMTLKKIDEIEAQMSMQWWKTKHGNSALPSTTNHTFGNANTDPNSARSAYPSSEGSKSASNSNLAYARTAPDDLTHALSAVAAKVQTPEPLDMSAPLASPAPPALPAPVAPVDQAQASPQPIPAAPPRAATAPAIEPSRPRPPAPVAAPAPKKPIMGGLAAAYDGAASTGFSASKLFALEVDEVQHDPELEEAAIRFANGDDAGAEAGLLEVLAPHGSRHHHEETWCTIFDLYRATGQHDRFESLAIDFAGKFHRSAPIWFSMPDMVGQLTSAAPAAAPTGPAPKSDWRCPANFGLQTLPALNAALARSTSPWTLDWGALKTLEPPAVVPLTKLFAGWSKQAVQLRFMGAQVLEDLLRNTTPSGVRDTSQDLWQLRLEHLRITHRPDEFELAALDFCVTYEVSPPSWEKARCEYKSADVNGVSGLGQTIIGEAVHDSVMSEMSAFDEAGVQTSGMQPTQLSAVELSGQIQGDPVGTLEKLETRLEGADVMLISCAKLIRVDFSAAGTLLNWVSARQSEGRVVHFTDVHRLVAAFFHVIGISEHAKITTRQN
jgi:ABC-type transporter Mla MlaB component